ncbi:MAG: hypothetical protein H0V89_05405 [Deltaproteobacteria bacterium]|nr:hypothetical protein [Deltaproteobacteria bacterium]
MTNSEWTRRAVLATSLASLACTGGSATDPQELTKSAQGKNKPGAGDPRPGKPDVKPGGGKDKPRKPEPGDHRLGGREAGDLYLPDGPGEAGKVRFTQSPAWFRNSVALFAPTCGSAGSGLMQFGPGSPPLKRHIGNFSELPKLLAVARSMGSDILYLVDWYQNESGTESRKGDYYASKELGGSAALKQGIAAVQAQGGRVILYMEGFIVARTSETGLKHGEDWSIKEASGETLGKPYPGAFPMCPATEGWRKFVLGVGRRIVGEYGANGVFLDSYGIQTGWECHDPNHGHELGKSGVFNRGCVEIVGELRKTIQTLDREAVVMCEGPEILQMFGAADATLDWGIQRYVARPVWDSVGQSDIFTTNFSFDDIHQLVAMGAKIALPPQFHDDPPQSAVAWVASERKGRPQDRREEKALSALQTFVDGILCGVHQVRNAGIAAGARVPGIDDVAPRKLFADEWNSDTVEARFDELAERAKELDAALAGVNLRSPAAHLGRVLRARAAVAPIIDAGATIKRIETDARNTVAWQFDGPGGRCVTAVNTGNDAVTVALPDGRWEELVSGKPAGKARLELAGHSVAILTSRGA